MVVLEMVVSAPVQVLQAHLLMQTLDLAAVAAEVETHLLVVMVLLVSLSSHIHPN
tara:strand:+ start:335 stop:499 length:165 start_codon:yes stop_codon:yes gene_type:complete